MQRRHWLIYVDVIVLGLVGYGITNTVWKHRGQAPEPGFAQAVALAPIEKLAVQADGRIKAFASFAREMMRVVSGRRQINGQSATFTYLDLMLRPTAYDEIDVVYVKNKNIRSRMIAALGDSVSKEWADGFLDRGLISRARLNQQELAPTLRTLRADVMRTAKDVDRIESALAVADAQFLRGRLTVVPPPGGDEADRWFALGDLVGPPAPEIEAHAGISTARTIPGLSESVREKAVGHWNAFVGAWKEQDAPHASQHLAEFASDIRGFAPAHYPTVDAMSLENWYFKNKGMTWVWLVYLAAVVPLLMSVVYRWQPARLIGLLLFCVACALHTAALLIRWKVADRWPNSNMFEAIHTAAWFGVVGAVVLEWVARRTPMRNMFALGASVCAMAALMAGRYTDAINPEITNFMPILDDIWLYIHTNMIIWSYALIGMASITGLLYLRYRLGGGNRNASKAGGAGALILARAPGGQFLRDEPATTGQVLDGATMILMELSFIMLWAGLVMGAIWADHSWGRPWGWDPKEVFALNTFIVFMLLVHVRFKARDKGVWTALLAVLGCAVMLFNWIVINFSIKGLHSYA